MRSLILSLCLIVSLAAAAFAKPKEQELLHFEPAFGITYLPSQVRFEPAPPEVFRCTTLLEPRRKLWVFGKHNKGKVTFYYVYGLIEVDFGTGPTGEFEAESDDGIIVVVSPEGCKEIGAGYAMSSNPEARKEARDIGIADDVLSALLTDLIQREVKAFGGVEQFLGKVKATGLAESTLDPLLREKLQALRKRAASTGNQSGAKAK